MYQKDSNKYIIQREENKGKMVDSDQTPQQSSEEKKISELESIKFLLFSCKRYVLSLFPVILAAIFLGSICSSLQKNGYTLYFIFCLLGIILLTCLSIFLIRKTRTKLVNNCISQNFLLLIIFAYMFISGFILMIFFKLLSIINAFSVINLTGLISVIIVVIYLLSLIIGALIDFVKIKSLLKKKKH